MEVHSAKARIVLDGDPAPPPKRGSKPPIFGRYLLRPNCWMDQDATCQMAGWIKMPLGRQVGLSQSDIVLAGDPAPPSSNREQSPPPIFGRVYFGQTAGWIKMPLGTEVGLGPGHIVLDGDPAPLPKGAQPPNFRPISVVAKWLDGSRCHMVWR